MSSKPFVWQLWTQLSGVEKSMPEQLEKLCVKIIQNLSRSPDSNMSDVRASIEGRINHAQLKPVRRLRVLPSTGMSRQVFLQRLFQTQMGPDTHSLDCKELIK